MAKVFGINLGQRILIYLMSQFKPNHTGWRFDRQSALNFSIGFELTSLKKTSVELLVIYIHVQVYV